MNFVLTSVLFVAGIITFIVCAPMFNVVIGMLPLGDNIKMFASLLVLLLVVVMLFTYVRSNLLLFQQGGEYR